MDSIKELWQRHPWEIAGGLFVLGLIVIYYYYGRGSSAPASGGVPSDYYAAQGAAIASGNSLAALYSANATASYQADAAKQAAIAKYGADVKIADSNNLAAEHIAVTDSTTATHQSDNDLAGILAGVASNTTIARAQYKSATDIAGFKSASDIAASKASVDIVYQKGIADAGVVYQAGKAAENLAYQTGIATSNAIYQTGIASSNAIYQKGIADVNLVNANVALATVGANERAAARSDVIGSITSSYQNVGNYPYADYLAQLAALSPGGHF